MKILSGHVLAFLITGGAVVARASDSESERQTLKGLKGIAVFVTAVSFVSAWPENPESEFVCVKGVITTDDPIELITVVTPLLVEAPIPIIFLFLIYL